MAIHRINLRGPWEYEWLEPTLTDRPRVGRVKLPSDWREEFGDTVGRVRFLRRFHEPTGIEPGDRVWLHFTGIGGEATATLDGQPLGLEDGEARFDVTTALRPTNTIVVELTCDPTTTDEPLGLFGFVTIEIEPLTD